MTDMMMYLCNVVFLASFVRSFFSLSHFSFFCVRSLSLCTRRFRWYQNKSMTQPAVISKAFVITPASLPVIDGSLNRGTCTASNECSGWTSWKLFCSAREGAKQWRREERIGVLTQRRDSTIVETRASVAGLMQLDEEEMRDEGRGSGCVPPWSECYHSWAIDSVPVTC